MATFDSTVRLRQLNQPELSGYIVLVAGGIPSTTGILTGAFYPYKTNPSGYITTGQTGTFITQSALDSNYYSTLVYVANNYYPLSNPSGYVTSASLTGNAVLTTGDQNISGLKNFYTRPSVNGSGVQLQGEFLINNAVYTTGDQTINGIKTFAGTGIFNSDVQLSGFLRNGQGGNPSNSNFVGNGAGQNATSAFSSNFLGANAGNGATYASDSNFFGNGAGYGASDSASNNFLGTNAGNGAIGAVDCNFLGFSAGNGVTNASDSNFLGNSAGYNATNASFSNFFGVNAGNGATNANDSNFLGNSAGNGATNANNSIFIGFTAGNGATNAANSLFIGQSAGSADSVNNTGNGGSSILIGDYTNTSGFSNSISIGRGTANSASGQLNLGNVIFANGINTGTSPSNIAITNAKVGIGTNSPTYNLDVNGSGNFRSGLYINGVPVSTGSSVTISDVVYQTGNQTISGNKTFTGISYFKSGLFSSSLTVSGVSVLTGVNTGSFITTGQTGVFVTTGQTGQFAAASRVVYVTGSQTISGTKTFASDIYTQNLHVNGGTIQNDNGAVDILSQGGGGIDLNTSSDYITFSSLDGYGLTFGLFSESSLTTNNGPLGLYAGQANGDAVNIYAANNAIGIGGAVSLFGGQDVYGNNGGSIVINGAQNPGGGNVIINAGIGSPTNGNIQLLNGNVGIKTSSPVYTLDVNGSGNFTSGLFVSGVSVSTGINTGSFVTTGQTGSFATTGYVTGVSGYLRTLISNSSAGVTSLSVGAIAVSGTIILSGVNGLSIYTGTSNTIYFSGQSGNFVTTGQTGSFVTTSQTGVFVTTGQTGSFVTTSQTGDANTLGGQSGSYYLNLANHTGSLAGTGSFITSGQTGVFVTTGQTGSFVTTSQTGVFVTTGQTGSFVTTSQTGVFVTTGQTGSFITSGQTGSFVTTGYATGVSGYLQTQITNLSGKVIFTTGTQTISGVGINSILSVLAPSGLTGDYYNALDSGRNSVFRVGPITNGTRLAIFPSGNPTAWGKLSIEPDPAYAAGWATFLGVSTNGNGGRIYLCGLDTAGAPIQGFTALNLSYVKTVESFPSKLSMQANDNGLGYNSASVSAIAGGIGDLVLAVGSAGGFITNAQINTNNTASLSFKSYNNTGQQYVAQHPEAYTFDTAYNVPSLGSLQHTRWKVSGANIMSLNPSGRLGIRTDSPNYQLEVIGSGNFASGLFVSGFSVLTGEPFAISLSGLFSTGNQTGTLAISGTKTFTGIVNFNSATFVNRPTVNGTGVLLSGEASSATVSNVVYTTGNTTQTISGSLTVTGHFSANTKSFLIDHPTQVGRKLQYGVIEGPEHSVYIRGKLTGNDFIPFPNYWSGLVDLNSVTVSLTPIGYSQNLYINDVNISGVKVYSDAPVPNCYYHIFAERKDVPKLEVEI
jgi:hypothetical protein